MSRRVPNPAADRAAQNQQTIKSLLKLDANKSCADCKRNKRRLGAHLCLGHGIALVYLLDTNPCHNRSEMGELESRHLRLHTVRSFTGPTCDSVKLIYGEAALGYIAEWEHTSAESSLSI